MKIPDYLVGIVIMGIIFSAGFSLLKEINVKYPGITNDQTFKDLNGTLSPILDRMNASSSDFKQKTFLQRIEDIPNFISTMFSRAYQGLVSVVDSVGFMNDIITAVGQILGLPKYLAKGITAIITITLTFAIIILILFRQYY